MVINLYFILLLTYSAIELLGCWLLLSWLLCHLNGSCTRLSSLIKGYIDFDDEKSMQNKLHTSKKTKKKGLKNLPMLTCTAAVITTLEKLINGKCCDRD